VVRTESLRTNRHDTGSTTARSVDELALIRDTIRHYAPVLIAPLSIQIRRAGVQKKFGIPCWQSELSGTLALAVKGNTAPAAASDLLAAYLGGDAADRVSAGPVLSAGQVQRGSVSRLAAAILCADVCGFTNFAEETAPAPSPRAVPSSTVIPCRKFSPPRSLPMPKVRM
jgi:hypothetical protein